MGSGPQEEKSFRRVSKALTQGNNQLVNNILNTANDWVNHKEGTLGGKLYNTAMGNDLNMINEKEQELFNKQLDMANNSIQRQFAAAGRGGSFKNMQAVNDQTSNMSNQFLSDNFNRNRQAMYNAQNNYMTGQLNYNNQALAAIDQNSEHVNQKPGNTAFQNVMGLLGSIGSLVSSLGGKEGLSGVIDVFSDNKSSTNNTKKDTFSNSQSVNPYVSQNTLLPFTGPAPKVKDQIETLKPLNNPDNTLYMASLQTRNNPYKFKKTYFV